MRQWLRIHDIMMLACVAVTGVCSGTLSLGRLLMRELKYIEGSLLYMLIRSGIRLLRVDDCLALNI